HILCAIPARSPIHHYGGPSALPDTSSALPSQGRSATLSLVDLAGSERTKKTNVAGNKLRESSGINSSLTVLGRCLEALRHNQALAARLQAQGPSRAGGGAGGPSAAAAGGGAVPRVIPVRESSLTTLFRSVLTGEGNLVLSVHVSEHPEEYDMNLQTLRFGALASRVQTTVAAPVAAPAARPPLPPAARPYRVPQKRVAVAGLAGRGLLRRPAAIKAKRKSAILEGPELEEAEEGEQAGDAGDGSSGLAQQQPAAGQPEVEEDEEAELGAEADAGPQQQVPSGADAVVVESLRSELQGLRDQVQQLQGRCEQLDGEVLQLRGDKRHLQQQVEQLTETAPEWEALVFSEREEKKEAQRRVWQLEAQLAASQRELAGERMTNKTLLQRLSEAQSAAARSQQQLQQLQQQLQEQQQQRKPPLADPGPRGDALQRQECAVDTGRHAARAGTSGEEEAPVALPADPTRTAAAAAGGAGGRSETACCQPGGLPGEQAPGTSGVAARAALTCIRNTGRAGVDDTAGEGEEAAARGAAGVAQRDGPDSEQPPGSSAVGLTGRAGQGRHTKGSKAGKRRRAGAASGGGDCDEAGLKTADGSADRVREEREQAVASGAVGDSCKATGITPVAGRTRRKRHAGA
ncbi:hypothetical protein Agub_g979, partial [Astrephomene gubernaculifera]